MHLPRKSVLAGALLGIIPIALGIVALVTQSWLITKLNNTNSGTYGLFSCANVFCSGITGFRVVQGLEIAGVAAILVGVLIAVFVDMFTKNRWIRLLPQIFLFAGPTLILIGLLLFAKYVFEYITKRLLDGLGASSYTATLDLGYSIILIVVACLLGFLTAIYFAFVAGVSRHHGHVQDHHHNSAVVVAGVDRHHVHVDNHHRDSVSVIADRQSERF